jgi:hypothetical protein
MLAQSRPRYAGREGRLFSPITPKLPVRSRPKPAALIPLWSNAFIDPFCWTTETPLAWQLVLILVIGFARPYESMGALASLESGGPPWESPLRQVAGPCLQSQDIAAVTSYPARPMSSAPLVGSVTPGSSRHLTGGRSRPSSGRRDGVHKMLTSKENTVVDGAFATSISRHGR